MFAKTFITLSVLLLAGSMVSIGNAASCGDASYHGPFAPPVLKAPDRHHYYYFGAPGMNDEMDPSTTFLPMSMWHETNGIDGLQVNACRNSAGAIVGGSDTPDSPLLS